MWAPSGTFADGQWLHEAIILGPSATPMPGRPAVPLDHLTRAAQTVGRETGVRLITLFGSAVSPATLGRRSPEDLDLGVLGATPLDVIDLTNRLIRAIGVQDVDVTDLRRADPLLLMLVARNGIVLYEAEPGQFAQFVSLAARRFADTRKFRQFERDEVRAFVSRSVTGR
jgi:hypothetical protein